MRLFFLCLILWVSIGIFGSNLEGSFILDDWPNLNALPKIESAKSWKGIIEFLANNRSGGNNLSRPISLLSFALQADDWPQNPLAFKAVNLVLHLLNGLLIFQLSLYLLKIRHI